MKIVDLHCDTLSLLQNNKASHLFCNDYHVDIEKMIDGNYLLQNFAIFTHTTTCKDVKAYVLECMDIYDNELMLNKQYIKKVLCYKDIEENMNNGIMSSMLTLEEGDVIDDIEDLDYYYKRGVRMIALTWNFINRIGTPACINHEEGLSDFGIEYIKKMESLKMIIDVSHLNDQGIRDVAKYTKQPFVASHSNARSVVNVARNLPDELISLIDQRRGVIGINFYEVFLGQGTIEQMVKHIVYLVEIGSIDVVALGSDFDGIDGALEIVNASQMQKLVHALVEHGYSNEDIEKICYKNVLRVYKEVLNS